MSSSLLHFNQLDAFKAFCEFRGWKQEACKGTFECLRMRHQNGGEPLIVYSKMSATQHFTVHGRAEQMTQDFLNHKRNEAREHA